MITFLKDTDLSSVYKIKHVLKVKVRWEKYENTRGASQCHNCQKFGHATDQCFRLPKCVKCNKEHKTSKCDKAKENPPYCVNYLGNHRASSTQCPIYKKYIETLQKKERRDTTPIQEKRHKYLL